MTASSNTCDTHGSNDPRNCVGYAIREIYLGTVTPDGAFHDIMRHTPDQEQTPTYCSTVDPWHEPSDIGSTQQAQLGFDLFYTSGVTRGLPAMMPVAVLYDTPENAGAEIAYLKNRGYPISYVEMGEEADGQFTLPEDYAELYIQAAKAIHAVDPSLKLGGSASQLINLEWVQPGSGEQHVFPAKSDLTDGAGHALITAYTLRRPDDQWSVMIVNRDQFNAHSIRLNFRDDATHTQRTLAGDVAVSSFGRDQYQWHPASTTFMAHAANAGADSVIANTKGFADPDGPIVRSTKQASPNTTYNIPAASIVVLRGTLGKTVELNSSK
jgi:hypothetical protein